LICSHRFLREQQAQLGETRASVFRDIERLKQENGVA
jgi:hypothetical protein